MAAHEADAFHYTMARDIWAIAAEKKRGALNYLWTSGSTQSFSALSGPVCTEHDAAELERRVDAFEMRPHHIREEEQSRREVERNRIQTQLEQGAMRARERYVPAAGTQPHHIWEEEMECRDEERNRMIETERLRYSNWETPSSFARRVRAEELNYREAARNRIETERLRYMLNPEGQPEIVSKRYLCALVDGAQCVVKRAEFTVRDGRRPSIIVLEPNGNSFYADRLELSSCRYFVFSREDAGIFIYLEVFVVCHEHEVLAPQARPRRVLDL